MFLKSNLLLLTLIVLTISVYDHCEVLQKEEFIYSTPDQKQNLLLSNYIKGFDLKYDINSTGAATIKQSYTQIGQSEQLQFPADFTIIATDIYHKPIPGGKNLGVYIAHNGEDTIKIAQLQFKANTQLPKQNNYATYTLPQQANCFDGVIINNDFDVVVDCQTSEGTNYVCLLSGNGNTNCFKNKENESTNSTKRTSLLYQVDGKQYVFVSELKDYIDEQFKNNTKIYIYKIEDSQVTFKRIINPSDLRQKTLAITDIVELHNNNNQILISSTMSDQSSLLIGFVFDGESINWRRFVTSQYEVSSMHFSYMGTFDKNLYIASKSNYIRQYSAKNLMLGKKFEVDITDGKILKIQSNDRFLVFYTAKRQYIYDREQQSKMFYLLKQNQIASDSNFILSQYTDKIITIQSNKHTLFQISKPLLDIPAFTSNQSFTLTATSGNLVCSVTFSAILKENVLQIYSKRTLNNSMQVPDASILELNLNRYFGGSALKYAISADNPDINFDFDVVKNISLGKKFNYQLYTIIAGQLKQQYENFYLIGFIKNQTSIQINNCTLDNSKIRCNTNKYNIANPATSLKGIKKSDGSLVVVWTQQTERWGRLVINQPNPQPFYTANPYLNSQLTGIAINDKFVFVLMKKINQIVFFSNEGYGKISSNSFNQEQLQLMSGFSPRQIIIDDESSDLVTVKMVTGLALFGISNPQLKDIYSMQLINYKQLFKAYVPQTNWTMIRGSHTYLVVKNQEINEYSYDNVLLHQLTLSQQLSIPITYQEHKSIQAVSFLANEGKVVVVKLGSSVSDSFYYLIQNSTAPFVAQGNWIIFPQAGQSYTIPDIDMLYMMPNIPEYKFKQSFNLVINVTGLPVQQPYVVNTKLIVVNYPVNINQTDDNTVWQLPEKGNNDLIHFNMANFFTGSVTEYSLSCDYCQGEKIALQQPLDFKKIISTKNVRDIVGFSGKAAQPKNNLQQDYNTTLSFAGVLTIDSKLVIVNEQFEVKAEVKLPQNFNCSKMGISEKLTHQAMIFVLCTNAGEQDIIQYQYNGDNITGTISIHKIQNQNFYVKNPFKIEIAYIQTTFLLAIHDNDQTDENPKKNADIKLIGITEGAQQLIYTQVVNSKSFGLELQPINNFHLYNNKWFIMTVGSYGIAAARISSIGNSNGDAWTLNLKKVKQLQDYVLDFTQFNGVKIVDQTINQNILKILITTDNAAHIVFTIQLTDKQPTINFIAINEIYNRLGSQSALNWCFANEKYFLQPYHNYTSNTYYYGLYNRTKFDNKMTNLFASVALKIPDGVKTLSKQAIFKDNFVFYSSVDQGILSHKILDSYALRLNYDDVGNFDSIVINAKNDYSQTSHKVGINFDSSSLLWIILGIVIGGFILIAIIIGGIFACKKIKSGKTKRNKDSTLLGSYDDS